MCATLIIRFHTLLSHSPYAFFLLFFREQTTHISNIIKYCISSLGRFDDHRPSRRRLIHSFVCEKEWDRSVIHNIYMLRVRERHVNVMTEGASHERAMQLVWTSDECPSTEVADWSQQLPPPVAPFFLPFSVHDSPTHCEEQRKFLVEKCFTLCARCYFLIHKKKVSSSHHWELS